MAAPALTASAKPEYRTALAALLLGLVLIGALALAFGVSVDDVARAVRQVPWTAWIMLPAAHAALIILSALKWHLLLASTSDGVPALRLRHATASTAVGTLAGQVLPLQIVTPAIRAWTARRHGIPVARAVGTSVFEQVFEIVVLLSMAAAGLVAAVAGIAFGLLAGLALVILLFLAIKPALQVGAVATGSLERLAFPFLGRLRIGLDQAQMLPQGLLAKLMGLSILRYALMVWLNVQVLAWLVPGLPLMTLALAFPIVQAVTALPIVSGGLGLTEASWIGLLIASGLSAPEAAAIALSLRFVSTGAFLLACPFLVVAGLSGKQRAPA